MNALVARFKSADLDGNGVIDRDELRQLLERVGDGEDEVSMHWLTDEDIAGVMAQYDTNGDGVISFEEFVRMSQDKIFLTGKLL
jgi:Ca2+-binding EF-hand superfamily protein